MRSATVETAFLLRTPVRTGLEGPIPPVACGVLIFEMRVLQKHGRQPCFSTQLMANKLTFVLDRLPKSLTCMTFGSIDMSTLLSVLAP